MTTLSISDDDISRLLREANDWLGKGMPGSYSDMLIRQLIQVVEELQKDNAFLYEAQ